MQPELKSQLSNKSSRCKIPHGKNASCAPCHKLTAIICESDDLDFIVVTQHRQQAACTHLKKKRLFQDVKLNESCC